MSQPVLEALNLHRTDGDTEVLKGVDLSPNKGEVKALLGPSGSGRSTILRLLALLGPADGGEILLNGKQVGVSVASDGSTRPLRETQLARQRRDIGMVFQRFNLFAHLDVNSCRTWW